MGFHKAFKKSEYQRRIKDVKTRMESAGFDMLICQDPANMGWLSGFDGWSFYTPQAIILHQIDLISSAEGKAERMKYDRQLC